MKQLRKELFWEKSQKDILSNKDQFFEGPLKMGTFWAEPLKEKLFRRELFGEEPWKEDQLRRELFWEKPWKNMLSIIELFSEYP